MRNSDEMLIPWNASLRGFDCKLRAPLFGHTGPHESTPIDPAATQQRYDNKVHRLLMDTLACVQQLNSKPKRFPWEQFS